MREQCQPKAGKLLLTSMSDSLVMQVVDAEESLFRYVFRKFGRQSLVADCPIKEISDTWSQKFEHEATVGPVRTNKLEMIEHSHQMPRARLLGSNGG
jgi:hypothetical protein